jgi:hypothetical protein
MLCMIVEIDLNSLVIYVRNIDHRSRFIRLAIFLWNHYNISRLHICMYTVNLMCDVLGVLTHVIVQDF